MKTTFIAEKPSETAQFVVSLYGTTISGDPSEVLAGLQDIVLKSGSAQVTARSVSAPFGVDANFRATLPIPASLRDLIAASLLGCVNEEGNLCEEVALWDEHSQTFVVVASRGNGNPVGTVIPA